MRRESLRAKHCFLKTKIRTFITVMFLRPSAYVVVYFRPTSKKLSSVVEAILVISINAPLFFCAY